MSDLQVVKVVLFVCSSVKVWIYVLMGIQCKFPAEDLSIFDLLFGSLTSRNRSPRLILNPFKLKFLTWSLWVGKNLGDVPAHSKKKKKGSYENKTIHCSCSKPSAGRKKKWQIQTTINLHNIIHFYSLPAGFMPTLHMRAMRLSLGRNNFISPPWLMRRAMNLWSNKAETAFLSLSVPVTSVSLAISCFPWFFCSRHSPSFHILVWADVRLIMFMDNRSS